MKKESIFIHIPKTGGTTINCAMNNTKWQTKPDFNYRHINHDTKRSNSKDIFNPSNYDKYSEYNIFMLLRHPVDRIISEYYFIKDRAEFVSLLKPNPKNLKQYVENRQTQNYMIGFLIGKRMYDTDFVNEDDFEIVKNGIKNLPIHTGIFEKYSESMAYFEKELGIQWPKKIDVKRITLNRPEIDEVSDEIKNLIIEKNKFDFQLYNYCLEIFDKKTQKVNYKNIKFNKNKYDYVLKYTERFCLLGLNLNSKAFLQAQETFFDQLNIHLHKKLKISRGKIYTQLWNSAFVKAINDQFPGSILTIEINKILNEKEDPLEQTKAIAKVIDSVLLYKDKKNSTQYYSKMNFSEKLVKKPGLLSLFG